MLSSFPNLKRSWVYGSLLVFILLLWPAYTLCSHPLEVQDEPELDAEYMGKVIDWISAKREGGMRYALFAVTDDLFVLEELHTFRIQFERDDSGRATAIRGLYRFGREDRTPRTP
jgi:hypothetical protein